MVLKEVKEFLDKCDILEANKTIEKLNKRFPEIDAESTYYEWRKDYMKIKNIPSISNSERYEVYKNLNKYAEDYEKYKRNANFANQLIDYRKKQGYSRLEFARITGIPCTSLDYYEKGLGVPKATNRDKLEIYLGKLLCN